MSAVRRLNTLHKTSVQLVHGFAVASYVFRPLLRRLQRDSVEATLFRYPSVGLRLDDIVDRLSSNLREQRPDGIVAHSLGCVATWLAVHNTGWSGPLVLLAPPLTALPATRLIPGCMRWPFAPLLDHRERMTAPGFRLPMLTGCAIKTIAGRFDFSVPASCTRHPNVEEASVTLHTHNSMLFSASVARACSEWLVRANKSGEP
ncbi:alpha/beta fold hydrolase [Novipirellula caenicola]|uniref:AB hydrolase-1 domain-containing protein n=1 Tax=Novipirellula caenicola TaxID=1536901 RepID=A0ABP9VK78_9BACT